MRGEREILILFDGFEEMSFTFVFLKPLSRDVPQFSFLFRYLPKDSFLPQ
jgi:hypothetical protein